MNIDNLCKLLLEALAEAGFRESTLFNYRGVIRRFKAFCKGKGYSESLEKRGCEKGHLLARLNQNTMPKIFDYAACFIHTLDFFGIVFSSA